MTSTLPFYFLGGDFAQSASAKADQGAFVVLGAEPRNPIVPATPRRGRYEDPDPVILAPADFHVGPVYARRYPGTGARQYAGLIHELDRRFHFANLCLDPGAGGGGLMVVRELRATRQLIAGVETDCVPLVATDDPDAPAVSSPRLTLFKRGDPVIELLWRGLAGDDLLVDAMHRFAKDALDRREVLLLPSPEGLAPGALAALGEEDRRTLAEGDVLVRQLLLLVAETRADGTLATTARGAVRIGSTERKDLAYAYLYALVAFWTWVKRHADGLGDVAEDRQRSVVR